MITVNAGGFPDVVDISLAGGGNGVAKKIMVSACAGEIPSENLSAGETQRLLAFNTPCSISRPDSSFITGNES